VRLTTKGGCCYSERMAPTDQFTTAQSLTLLLTTESLLFAAFNVGLALGTPVAGGRNISRASAFRLALFAVLALTAVALGALLAWWQVFVDHWPGSFLREVEAAAAVAGITVQPIVSFIAAMGMKPPSLGA
jgi:hypothetical protein